MRTPWVCLVIFLLCPAILPADERAAEDAHYAPMPWGLVNTWWDIGADQPFESLAVDVTISDDIPASANLYIAPIGSGSIGKISFYGGLQTQLDGYTKADPALRKLGRGFIFSMWGERSLEAIRPADGGFFQSAGHEGDFVSVRRPFAWTKGKYTYRLTRMDQEKIAGQTYTWVGAFVHSHQTNENLFVGALRFKTDALVLDRKVANFVEVYGPQRPVADIPKVTITFGPPIINGVVASHPSAEASYGEGIPDFADTIAKDGSLLVTVGKPVKRTQRHVILIDGGK